MLSGSSEDKACLEAMEKFDGLIETWNNGSEFLKIKKLPDPMTLDDINRSTSILEMLLEIKNKAIS